VSSASSYLAIDLGASSGRAILGTWNGEQMHMHEVHRFRTLLIDESRRLCWDLHALWAEIRAAVDTALRLAPDLRSISVDSWGVDYVPLRADGEPVRRAYAYRDARTRGRLGKALARIPGGPNALYECTGIQFLDINTLPQVVADLEDEPDLVGHTATRLLIADYYLHKLCGVGVAERTLASTTQLLDARTGEWAASVVGAIGDDASRWPRIVPAGTVLGHLHRDLVPVSFAALPLVVASCSHDTAAAVAAVPAMPNTRWAYVCSGTWSLVGVERASPVLTPSARTAGFTNEAGFARTTRLLRNHTGMWVLEECVREWHERGAPVDYASLIAHAEAAPRPDGTINLDARALTERGDMPAKVRAACIEHGVGPPETPGEYARLIFESLAERYRHTLDELEALTGERIDVVHVVGGGARIPLLNRLTAQACGRRVVAGPDEATALGNLLVQAHALGDLRQSASVRDVARASATLTEYRSLHPQHTAP
jgi:rhamnulokinase